MVYSDFKKGISVMIRRTLLLSVFALASACGGPGDSADIPEAQPAGATSADIGNHVVHFSAQSTDQLPPAVAREYNIVRSKNRAMLNVSVLRKSDNLPGAAEVTVNTVNLTRIVRFAAAHRYYRPEWSEDRNYEVFATFRVQAHRVPGLHFCGVQQVHSILS